MAREADCVRRARAVAALAALPVWHAALLRCMSAAAKSPFAQLGAKPRCIRLGGSTPRGGDAKGTKVASLAEHPLAQSLASASPRGPPAKGERGGGATPRRSQAAVALGESPYHQSVSVRPAVHAAIATHRAGQLAKGARSGTSSKAVAAVEDPIAAVEDPNSVFDDLLRDHEREADGTITRMQLRDFIVARTKTPDDQTEKLAQWAVQGIDLNGDGVIDRDEWLRGWESGMIVDEV